MTPPFSADRATSQSADALRWSFAPVREIRSLVEDGLGDEAIELLRHRPYEQLRISPELAVQFATALMGQNRLEDARQLAVVALGAARATGDHRGETLATMLCGEIALALGDLTNACNCFVRARALATGQHNPALAGDCAARVGQLALRRGDPATAVGAFMAATAAFESTGAERQALECQSGLATAYCVLEQYGDALRTLDRVVDSACDLGDAKIHADTLLARAEVRFAARETAVALSEAVQAAAMYRSLAEFGKESEALSLVKRAEDGDKPVASAQATLQNQQEAAKASMPELLGMCHV